MTNEVDSFYELHVQKFQPSGNNASAICPFHPDTSPSLSIERTTGMYNCHKCGAKGNMVTLAKEKGIALSSVPNYDPRHNGGDVRKSKITKPRTGFEIERTYDFRDEMGHLLYQEVRMKGKSFRYRRPDPNEKGKFIWNMADTEKVLYRTPELLDAHDRGVDTVYVVEGPKDVETLVKLGLEATTNYGGAGGWTEAYADQLTSFHVICIPDNDGPGRAHAEAVAGSLKEKAPSVKVLQLPGIPEKGDVTDWMEKGHSRAELEALAKSVVEWEPKGEERTKFSYIEPIKALLNKEFTDQPWLIDKIWPHGARGWIAGNPGSNKTWFAMEMAYSIVTGESFLGEFPVKDPGKVLYVQQELQERHHRERWDLMLPAKPFHSEHKDAFEEGFYHLTNRQLLLPEDCDGLIEWIKPMGFKAIILDSFSESHLANENSAHEMRSILMALTRIRNETGASVIVIHHLHKQSKESKGRSIFERMRGSSALWGWRNALIAMSTEAQDEFKSKVQFQFQVAETPPEFIFCRDLVDGGFRFSKQDVTTTDRFQDQCDGILEYLEKQPDPVSFNTLCKHVMGKRDNLRKAIQMMTGMGTVVKDGSGYRAKGGLFEEPGK